MHLLETEVHGTGPPGCGCNGGSADAGNIATLKGLFNTLVENHWITVFQLSVEKQSNWISPTPGSLGAILFSTKKHLLLFLEWEYLLPTRNPQAESTLKFPTAMYKA